MPYALRTGLTFCTIGNTVLFLDLPGDRYFRLPDRLHTAFHALVAGEPLEGEEPALLVAAGLIEPAAVASPIHPVSHDLPVIGSPAIASGAFRLGDVARVIAVQRRVERRLDRSALFDVLGELSRRHDNCAADNFALGNGAARVVRAFEFARLLRSAANRCLPRSIALAMCLAREGVRADVVLAVKLGPFAAHCWTQIGDQVLNDTPEEVARFTPILVA